MRRSLIVAAVLLLAAGVAAAVWMFGRGPSGGPTPTPGMSRPAGPQSDVTVAYPEEPSSFNPYLYEGDTNATRDLLRPLLPTLLRIDPSLRYRPWLASRVPSGNDIGSSPFSVTYHLRPDARWSDGTPITAADVRFTWETIRNSAWPIADRTGYDQLADVAAIDRKTVRLVFDRPYAAWRDLFSAGDFILPKHVLQGKDFGRELADGVPVSGGPFVLVGRTKGLEVVYAANPRWWGPAPGMARVRVQIVPDIETALQLLGRGRVNAVAATTQSNLERRMRRVPGTEVAATLGSAWWELGFQVPRPGLSDPRVRRAVAAAVDRAAIVEALVRGEGRGLQGLAPGRSSQAFAGLGHDPETARRLMQGAGFRLQGDRFTRAGVSRFEIDAPAENEMAALVQRALEAGLRGAGIDVEVRSPHTERFYASWRREGRFDLAVWERRGTPSMSLRSAYHSTQQPPAGLNYTRVASAELDRALDAADGALTGGRAAFDEVTRQLSATLPALPLFEARVYLGYQSGYEGLRPNATVEGPFWNLEEWSKR